MAKGPRGERRPADVIGNAVHADSEVSLFQAFHQLQDPQAASPRSGSGQNQ